MQRKTFLAGVFALLFARGAFAHSGRTDKNGCHTDRRTGIRHCH